MKIGFDISYLQKRRAGIGRYTEGLLESLLNLGSGHEFILHGWSFSLDRRALREVAGDTVRLDAARIPGPLKRLYWNRVRFPSIETFLGSIDVFQSMDPLVPPALHARTVATVHDLAIWTCPRFVQKKVLRLGDAVRRSLTRADAIITPSESIKTEIMETLSLPSSKIHAIPPAVNPSFSLTDEAGRDRSVLAKFQIREPYILHVGTLEPRKNTASVIRAFAILRELHTSAVQLVLAGKKGWMYDDVLQALRDSPVRADIRQLDYVSDQDLSSLYRRAGVFVFPSYYEGFGSPLVEAMSSGAPVITSDIPALRETVARAARLVHPGRVEEIASALAEVLDNASTRDNLVQLGIQRVLELRAAHSGQRLLALYEGLAAQ